MKTKESFVIIETSNNINNNETDTFTSTINTKNNSRNQIINKNSSENIDDFSIISSKVSGFSSSDALYSNIQNDSIIATENNKIGFWNDMIQNVNDIGNKIKFNLLNVEDKLEATNFPTAIQIFDTMITDFETLTNNKKFSFVWLSYRSNIEAIVYNDSLYTSDAGWGCTIRATQMMFAKAILEIKKRRLTKEKNTNDNYINNVRNSIPLNTNEIIRIFNETVLMFLDNPVPVRLALNVFPFKKNPNLQINEEYWSKIEELNNISSDINSHIKPNNKPDALKEEEKVTTPFSIKKIVMNCNSNKGAGDWYSNFETVKAFKAIFEKNKILDNVSVLEFNQGYIYLEDIFNSPSFIKTEESDICNCGLNNSFEEIPDTNTNIDIENIDSDYNVIEDGFLLVDKDKKDLKICECFENYIKFKSQYFMFESEFIVLYSTRLGLQKLESEYYTSLLEYFSLSRNLGMVSGKANRSVYILGHTIEIGNDIPKLIFADPHFVQNSENIDSLNNKNIQTEQIKSYVANDLNLMRLDEMSAAFTVGFYVTNKNEFVEFVKELERFSQNDNKSRIIKLKDSKHRRTENNIDLNDNQMENITTFNTSTSNNNIN